MIAASLIVVTFFEVPMWSHVVPGQGGGEGWGDIRRIGVALHDQDGTRKPARRVCHPAFPFRIRIHVFCSQKIAVLALQGLATARAHLLEERIKMETLQT